jgi:creatinine amidohydrolase
MSKHHQAFPGTVDLGHDVVAGFVRAYIAMLDSLGVRDVVLFSAHGGNFRLLDELRGEYVGHERLTVIAYADITAYLSVMVHAAASAGLEAGASDTHAGGLETSQMLFLHGPDRIPVPPGLEGYVAAEPGWRQRMHAGGIQEVSPNGILGRPAGATAEAGAAICAALADELASWLTAELGLESPSSVTSQSNPTARS